MAHRFRLLLALVLMTAGASLAVPHAATTWLRLDSPHFVVIGNTGADDVADVARQFEAFRETLTRLLGARATESPVPTVVFVFDRDRDFEPFKLLYKGKAISVTGLCMTGADLNQIALVPGSQGPAAGVIFHEYTHEIVANVVRRAPVWLSEGLAEYYSSFEIRNGGRRAVIGNPMASRVTALASRPLLPVETLITVDHESPLYNDDRQRTLFYAESWALVHYLVSDPQRREQLSAYLERLDRDEPPVQAWRAVFGAGIDTALRQYLLLGAFKAAQVDFAERVEPFSGAPAPLSDADARAALAGLLTIQGRLDEALRLLEPVKALTAEHPALAIRLAQIDVARGDRAGAERRLYAVGVPDDWLAAYEAGIVMSRIIDRPGIGVASDEVAAITRLFDHVERKRGAMANLIARRAAPVLWTSDVPSMDAIADVGRARALAPGRDDFTLLYAQLIARRGQFAEARILLAPYLGAGQPADIREKSAAIMDQLSQYEENVKRRLDAAAERARRAEQDTPALATTAPPAPAAAPTRMPAAPAPDQLLLRRIQPGEQRLQGTLDRIACAKNGLVTFHLRTAAGPVTARANLLSLVEFISYRTDIRGVVACGGPPSPMPVYVTWRPGPSPGSKYVAAVEFLPGK